MRDAIDRYKNVADRDGFQTKVDSENYLPDLEALVKSVDVQGKKMRFLCKIHIDPMTGTPEWGCVQCRTIPIPGAARTCSNVYTKSQGNRSGRHEGIRYKDW